MSTLHPRLHSSCWLCLRCSPVARSRPTVPTRRPSAGAHHGAMAMPVIDFTVDIRQHALYTQIFAHLCTIRICWSSTILLTPSIPSEKCLSTSVSCAILQHLALINLCSENCTESYCEISAGLAGTLLVTSKKHLETIVVVNKWRL